MGRLNRGPNGPFSGKAGSVIGSSWRGIYYIKGLQKTITKARSPLQLEQQKRFALAVKFLYQRKNVLDMGFSTINPGGATGYNMAISHFLRYSIKGSYPDYEINYPAVVFTLGNLTLPEDIKMELNGMTLKLKWSTESDNRHAFANDQLCFLIYYPKLNIFQPDIEEISRSLGETELVLNDMAIGDIPQVYIYLLKDNGKKWSNSLYLGALEVEG